MSEATLVQTPVQRALALQTAHGAALEEGEGERIAYEIIEAATAAGKTVEEYVVEYAQGLDVAAPREGMKSAFWSYGIPHPDLPMDKVLSSQFLAAVWTDMENGNEPDSARYLEGTPGGQALDELHLWNPDVYKVLGLNEQQGNALARQAWSAVSENYAKATDGEAIVFGGELVPWSVAYETEMPRLRRGTGPENIHFMYDLPGDLLKGLPPESRQLLSSGPVRSHVHFKAPDPDNPPTQKYWEAGYLDLEHLRSLPTPEAQRAAILEACERVALVDAQQTEAERQAEADLSTEQEVSGPPVEEQRRSQIATPSVSTHGVFLPGVTVDVHATVSQPVTQAGATPAGTHGVFLPGVEVEAKNVVAPSASNAATTPTHAPPTPEKSNDPGLGM
ncbi:hypothetical protein [Streptomyces sp. BK239]|uniref:hypothetical protein n=1 Tax=Streptomyces sp. BK239 TaxID=2512155 RepID=UPI00102B25DA|nr:hypothetical protein [Streptomyces sp. BK239]RZU21698.1 hypothetical protein EV567_2203 [Streptomyces sp. BK239]